MPHTNVRHLRRVLPPLAGYLRVDYRDAVLVTRHMAQGMPMGGGVIVDPEFTSPTRWQWCRNRRLPPFSVAAASHVSPANRSVVGPAGTR